MKAFVTGASRGIGRALTERLLAEGAEVVGVHRSPSAASEGLAQRAEGQPLTLLRADLEDAGARDGLLTQLAGQAFDAVVLNAGVAMRRGFEEGEGADDPLVHQLRADLEAPLLLLRALLRRRMVAEPASVVFTGSNLARHGLPFRMHVTFDENVGPMLDAIEAVNEEIPVGDLRWTLEHAETISQANIERVRALGGSIGVQGRLAMHGDDLRNTQGTEVAAAAAPLRRLVDAGLHMSLGTDGLRANTLNPWLTLFWATTGRSISGAQIMDRNNVLSRSEALEAYTLGSAYYQHQESIKGRLAAGQLADFALLSDDFFEVPDEAISDIHSVMTVVDGELVYGEGPYADEARSVPAPIPAWSPVHHWPGYHVPE